MFFNEPVLKMLWGYIYTKQIITLYILLKTVILLTIAEMNRSSWNAHACELGKHFKQDVENFRPLAM